ncbi:hypothetical protein NYG92_05445 [Campylobacter felis]|nr:hypothetical protein [Campylobacter felis]MDL0110196.1 hypothetical protein [Campylobacter felis]
MERLLALVFSLPYWQGEVVRVWKNRLLGLGLNELRGELGLLR